MTHNLGSKEVESLLKKPAIHQQWSDHYRNPENEAFSERAFARITGVLNPPPARSVVLDAGCGSCRHSIRLANRGFLVHAVDFSETVLTKARRNVSAKQLTQQITIHRANLRSLPFRDSAFRYVLCWGVLMHIPDLDKAISELVRVLGPGGTLIISENNMYSLQGMIRFVLKRLLGIGRALVKKTPAGLEYWYRNAGDALLTRQTNIRWLIHELESNGFVMKAHFAGQFTDLYTSVSSPVLKRLIQGFNDFWFKYVKTPYLAAGNILIAQKAD
jgi:ubiquinone/menaquinone biosynthesis C-methylase UbiE